MHAYRRFVETEMRRRGWRQRDLAAASGLSTAVVSRLLNDTRTRITQLPEEETLAGLARAFDVSVEVVLAHVGEAMGIPVSVNIETTDISEVPLSELIAEMGRRASAGEALEGRGGPAPTGDREHKGSTDARRGGVKVKAVEPERRPAAPIDPDGARKKFDEYFG